MVRHDEEYYRRYLNRLEQRIGSSEAIRPRNKELLLRYPVKGSAKGQGTKTVATKLQCLLHIAELTDFDFDKATREQLEGLVSSIRRGEGEEWTKASYLMALKVFYRIVVGDGEIPKEAKWIKAKPDTRKADTEKIKNLLLPEDVDKLVQTTPDIRLKAFIRFLFESGGRIGEVLPMRISDVRFDGDVVEATLSGKSGPRTIPLVASAPLLAQLLDGHPLKDKPDAPLWYGERKPSVPMDESWLRDTLVLIASRAGVHKRMNFHGFRHGCATHLSGVMHEREMEQYLGWRPGSPMPRVYVHRSATQLRSAVRRIHGLEQPQGKAENGLPIRCDRCGAGNDKTARFCGRCALPFYSGEAAKVKQDKQIGEALLAKLLERAEVLAAIQKVVQENPELLKGSQT